MIVENGSGVDKHDTPPKTGPSPINPRANLLLALLHPLIYILLVLPLIPGYPITQDAFFDVLLKYFYCYPAFIVGAVGLLSVRYHLSRGENILNPRFFLKIALITGIITCLIIPLTFDLSEDVRNIFILLNLPISGLVLVIGYGLISEHRSLIRKLQLTKSPFLTLEGLLVSLYYFYPPTFLAIFVLLFIAFLGG